VEPIRVTRTGQRSLPDTRSSTSVDKKMMGTTIRGGAAAIERES
jgi:hypothetical protein